MTIVASLATFAADKKKNTLARGVVGRQKNAAARATRLERARCVGAHVLGSLRCASSERAWRARACLSIERALVAFVGAPPRTDCAPFSTCTIFSALAVVFVPLPFSFNNKHNRRSMLLAVLPLQRLSKFGSTIETVCLETVLISLNVNTYLLVWLASA